MATGTFLQMTTGRIRVLTIQALPHLEGRL